MTGTHIWCKPDTLSRLNLGLRKLFLRKQDLRQEVAPVRIVRLYANSLAQLGLGLGILCLINSDTDSEAGMIYGLAGFQPNCFSKFSLGLDQFFLFTQGAAHSVMRLSVVWRKAKRGLVFRFGLGEFRICMQSEAQLVVIFG